MIKTEDTGWAFCAIRDNDFTAPLTAAKAVVEAYFEHCPENLVLDFAGFDVGVTVEGVAHIIEINTAPGLGDVVANEYAELFMAWINDGEQEEAAVVAELVEKDSIDWPKSAAMRDSLIVELGRIEYPKETPMVDQILKNLRETGRLVV